MDKITTTDCYTTDTMKGSVLDGQISTMVKYGHLKKHTDMIVLTKEQFEKIVRDAWEAGRVYQQAAHSEYHGGSENEKPTKSKYIATLFNNY